MLAQFHSPLIYLLLGAVILDLFLGESIDAIVILGIVIVNALLGFFQENRSENVLKLLKKYLTPRAHVIRDDDESTISAEDVVLGDLLILRPGDIVSADAKIIEATGFFVDESILTGETVEIEKKQLDQVYAGTKIVKGFARAEVVNTGNNTAWGKVAKETAIIKRSGSWEKDIAKFSRAVLWIIGITIILMFVINIMVKGNNTNWLELTLFSVALAVSVIPEALPVVITFSLSRGAMKLAKDKVVVKRLSAVEDLGNIEILCTDKTGTLTENKLVVNTVHSLDKNINLYAAMTCIPAILNGKNQDAFDVALWNNLDVATQKLLLENIKIVQEFPFDPEKRQMSVEVIWNKKKLLISRGVDYKNSPWSIDQGHNGYRVLAITLSKKQIGLISFTDAIKPTTFEAVHMAHNLGLSIKVLTGDAAEVAGHVAKQIGLIADASQVILGDDLDKMDIKAQHDAVEKFQVFARVNPLQKEKIIDLLQEKHRVGFLGEGINDGPALKTSDVGLVVDHAADVAREAADIILLKKDLKVIVNGIHQGRIVSSNTRKYIAATLSSNFGNFYAVSIASLLVNFLPMLPLQILLLNLLSDLPMISIATDNVDKSEMDQPVKFDLKNILTVATVLGLVSTVFDFIFFALFHRLGAGVLQTSWFMGSVLTELVFLYSIRTRKFLFSGLLPSMPIWILTGLAASIAVGLPFTNLGSRAFGFVKPSGSNLVAIFIVVALYLISTEIVKLIYFYKPRSGKLAAS